MIMNAFPRGVAGELKIQEAAPWLPARPPGLLRVPAPRSPYDSDGPRWSPYFLPPFLSRRRPLFHTPARAESPKLANLGEQPGFEGALTAWSSPSPTAASGTLCWGRSGGL